MTHPDHQRKGLAGRLLRVACDQADAEGKDAYIEASPDGYPVYVKAGFEEIDRKALALEKYGGDKGEVTVSVCMVRKPKSKQAV
jgi:GNAT superfamily N-acetyltransferase